MYITIKVNMDRVDIDNSVFGLSLSTCDIFVSLAIPTCHFSTFQAKARPTFHFYKNLDKSANFNCQSTQFGIFKISILMKIMNNSNLISGFEFA